MSTITGIKAYKLARKWLYVIFSVLLLLIFIFPFYFTLITSLKYEKDMLQTPVKYWPSPATFENYTGAWRDSNFALYFYNTIFIAVFVLIFVSFLSLLAGYAMSRYKFKGKTFMMVLYLTTQMVPSALLLIPIFLIVQNIGLINTLWSVIIVVTAMLLAYCSVLMRGFFGNISVQLEQAAWIDGCSRFQAVVLVIFPLILPGLVATGAYAFVNAWNQFLLPLILVTSPNRFTLVLALKSLIGEYTIAYGRLSAAGIICLIPAVAMFSYIQKYLVTGINAGALKG